MAMSALMRRSFRLLARYQYLPAFSSCKRASSSVSYPLQLSSVSANHAALYEESLQHPERFWGDLARRRLRWFKEFDQVMDCDMNQGRISWFNGGKINISGWWVSILVNNGFFYSSDFAVNAVDRHAEMHPDKVAIIWEQDALGSSQTVTYW